MTSAPARAAVAAASGAAEPARAGAGAILEVRDLVHRYGSRMGLLPVSFWASSPSAVGIHGANGSGKSTLLRILAGLMRPSGGAVTLAIGGSAVAWGDRARRVGYASPELAFYPELTVAENLGFAAETRGLDRAGERVRESLARVGLSSRAGDRAAALSSGMLQRLRIAFALLHHPAVLLLDEPESHLDREGRDTLVALVRREQSERLVVVATNERKEWTLVDQWVELEGRGLGDPA